MEAVPEEEAVGDNTNAVSLKGRCLVQLGVPMAQCTEWPSLPLTES